MATKSKRHIHKYHRVTSQYVNLWACGLPDCNHHMPKHLEGMVDGKASICWECGEQFILDPRNMKLDKPLCNDCMPNIIPDELLTKQPKISESKPLEVKTIEQFVTENLEK